MSRSLLFFACIACAWPAWSRLAFAQLCNSDADCGGDAAFCVNSFCVQCRNNADCQGGATCFAGSCLGGTPQSCGDGIVSGNEECDDGNQVPSDGCDNCHLEPIGCGDGVIDPGKKEACDPANPAYREGSVCNGCKLASSIYTTACDPKQEDVWPGSYGDGWFCNPFGSPAKDCKGAPSACATTDGVGRCVEVRGVDRTFNVCAWPCSASSDCPNGMYCTMGTCARLRP